MKTTITIIVPAMACRRSGDVFSNITLLGHILGLP